MVKLAVIQMQMSKDYDQNIEKASKLVNQAAHEGAQVVLLPELFSSLYFCQLEREEFFSYAQSQDSELLKHFQNLARSLQVVLPISYFEKASQAYFNSLVVFDADGSKLGNYRKSHIPDGPGYEEKYYFSPGDSGFKVWNTRYLKLGVGICWDQWFPECARIMALKGADLLLYPTAIGSEPNDIVSSPNTPKMWQTVMMGHAIANSCYLAAANRSGSEQIENANCDFYGHSFICDYAGNKLSELKEESEAIIYSHLDIDSCQSFRAGMGLFRDRRPDLYRPLLSLDGNYGE